jgi:hypothetical protein
MYFKLLQSLQGPAQLQSRFVLPLRFGLIRSHGIRFVGAERCERDFNGMYNVAGNSPTSTVVGACRQARYAR